MPDAPKVRVVKTLHGIPVGEGLDCSTQAINLPPDILAIEGLPPGAKVRAVLVEREEQPNTIHSGEFYVDVDDGPSEEFVVQWDDSPPCSRGTSIVVDCVMVQPPESDAERRSRETIEQFCAKHGLQLSKYAEPLKQLVDDAAKGGG